jgi:hypothetical protein
MSTARVPGNPTQAHSMEEKIRFRAYLTFEKRGGEHGRDLDDWLQAEAEILQQFRRATPIRSAPARKVSANKSNNHH